VIGHVAGHPVTARLDGILRGLIRPGTAVVRGLKLGDIDSRGRREYCDTISDKARAIAGAALEGVMRYCNVA
jgi:xanthine dehydrogenase accessory factor